MDLEADKRLIARFYEEVWARGNVEFAEEVFADDYVRHDLWSSEAAPGACRSNWMLPFMQGAPADVKP